MARKHGRKKNTENICGSLKMEYEPKWIIAFCLGGFESFLFTNIYGSEY